LLSRFFQWLFAWALRNGWMKIDDLPAPGRPATKRQVFTSWDDVPPEIREQIDEARRTAGTVIRFRDETSGEDRTFNSWDEVPEHLRAKIPAAIREQMTADLGAALEQADFASAGPGPIVVRQATTSRIVDFNVEQCRFGEFPRQDCEPTDL
jgi:nicotinamidase-related amidase